MGLPNAGEHPITSEQMKAFLMTNFREEERLQKQLEAEVEAAKQMSQAKCSGPMPTYRMGGIRLVDHVMGPCPDTLPNDVDPLPNSGPGSVRNISSFDPSPSVTSDLVAPCVSGTTDEMKYVTKDSGQRQEFETGAKRDTEEGKPRYDLIPVSSLRRLAELYQRGSLKYGCSNWEKGLPFQRCIASILRHIYSYFEGDRAEDHLAAVAWGCFSIMAYEEMIKKGKLPGELDDLPGHEERHQAIDKLKFASIYGSPSPVPDLAKAKFPCPVNGTYDCEECGPTPTSSPASENSVRTAETDAYHAAKGRSDPLGMDKYASALPPCIYCGLDYQECPCLFTEKPLGT